MKVGNKNQIITFASNKWFWLVDIVQSGWNNKQHTLPQTLLYHQINGMGSDGQWETTFITGEEYSSSHVENGIVRTDG
jgi:hypothetical protein